MLHTSITRKTETSPFSIHHYAIENTVKAAALSASVFRADLQGLQKSMNVAIGSEAMQHAAQFFIKSAADSAAAFTAAPAALRQNVYSTEARQQHVKIARLKKSLHDDFGIAVQDAAKYVVKAALERPCKAAKHADLCSAGGKINMFTFNLSQEWNNDADENIQDLRSIATIALLETLDFNIALKAVQHEQYILKASQPGTKYARSCERLDDEAMQAIEDTIDYFNQCSNDNALPAEYYHRNAQGSAATFIQAQKTETLMQRLHLTEVQQRTVLTLAKYNGNVTQAAKALNRSRQTVTQNRNAAEKKAQKAGIEYKRKCIPALVHGIQGAAAHEVPVMVQWNMQWKYAAPAYNARYEAPAAPAAVYDAMQHAAQYFVKSAADSAAAFTAAPAAHEAHEGPAAPAAHKVYEVFAGKIYRQDAVFKYMYHPIAK